MKSDNSLSANKNIEETLLYLFILNKFREDGLNFGVFLFTKN